jgi:hypothetical protein
VSVQNNKAVIHISSEIGIGSATVELIEGRWPRTVLLRLHLRGLEGITVSNGTMMLERPELSVTAFDASGNPTDQKYLCDDNGYFEVHLPDSLFDQVVTAIRIEWVDFYRE